MKKLIAGMLALLMLLCGAALADEDGYLYNGMVLAEKVGELAQDDAYRAAVTGRNLDCADSLKKAVFSDLKSAWRCEFPEDEVTKLLFENEPELSEAGKERMLTQLPSEIFSSYNGLMGTDELVAGTVLTYSRTYRMAEGFGPCIYVLELEGAMVGVAFVATGESTITASAMPIFYEEGSSAEQVIDGLSMGELQLSFEKIA